MTIEELKNMEVKIRGYTMPDDNAPDFYKRCKLSEALDIMKDFEKIVPKDFCNFIFTITDEDDDILFEIRRNLKTIYVEEINKFDLTEDIIKEILGIE